MLDYSEIKQKQSIKKQFILDEIKKRRERLYKKEEAIANLTYEKMLIWQDIVNVIREDLRNSGWNLFEYIRPGILREAWIYANHCNDTDWWENEEDKEDCRLSFDFVNSTIKKN